jgi:hypothetical protein
VACQLAWLREWLRLHLLLHLLLHPAACRRRAMPQHQQRLRQLLLLLAQVRPEAARVLCLRPGLAAAWARSLWQLLVVLSLVWLLQLAWVLLGQQRLVRWWWLGSLCLLVPVAQQRVRQSPCWQQQVQQ